MKEIKMYNERLDEWEWNDGNYVVIECDDEEEASRVHKLIRMIGLFSQEINNEN